MQSHVRRAAPSDVSSVVLLISALAAEVYEQEAVVTAEALLDDGFGTVLEFCVAEGPSGDLDGFAAWEKTYDLISGTRGGALLALYVQPNARGRGIGHALLTCVAHEVRSIRGYFLLGLGEQRPRVPLESSAPGATRPSDEQYARLLRAADLTPLEAERLIQAFHLRR